MMHCGANTGYAIAPLEETFCHTALAVTGGDPERVHFTYPSLDNGSPRNLPDDVRNVCQFDARSRDPETLRMMADYVREHRIKAALGFDIPVTAPALAHLRAAGLRCLVSYWGAPMSSFNHGPRLWLKRLEVRMRRHQPDHYVFESEAMRRTATHGRGIPRRATSVVHLGIDTNRFAAAPKNPHYAHEVFDIPAGRRIVFYAGHMEPRKGVHVILRAARDLVVRQGRDDVHFLFVGNRPGEEDALIDIVRGTRAENHVTFGGYRGDIPELLGTSHIGVIASTGWDSFPRSAVEMAAAGLPMVVSRLQGLVETIEDTRTGFLFEPGDYRGLANRVAALLDDPARHASFARRARERAVAEFSRERQLEALTDVVRRATAACA